MTLKEIMDMNTGNLPGLLFQGKQNIDFVSEKSLHAARILENREYLDLRIGFSEKAHSFRQEIDGLPYHQADGNTILVLGAEILPLLYGALEVLPHGCEKGNELGAGRRERCAFAGSLEDCEAHFLLKKFDLVGKGRLADEKVVGRPAEVQSVRDFYTVIDLFCGHGSLL